MPVTVTRPGVHQTEVSSGVRSITGVDTSVTAFIGRARRGSTEVPRLVQSFTEFQTAYGGFWDESVMPSSVHQYFLNGGRDALICRVHNGATAATLMLPANFRLVAASEGEWGAWLRARVDHETPPDEPRETAGMLFNLSVKDTATGTVERFANVSAKAGHHRYVRAVLEEQSNLVRIDPATRLAGRPDTHADAPSGADPLEEDASSTAFEWGSDGDPLNDTDVSDAATLESRHRGLWLLEHAESFNLLVIPPLRPDRDVSQTTWNVAADYVTRRRAFLIADAPAAWDEAADMTAASVDAVISQNVNGSNAALYFPRIRAADPGRDNRLATFAPSGAVAGVYARTDAQRGVWKAPAGRDAGLAGVPAVIVELSDGENGELNRRGVNCLRTFPGVGCVVWGARTCDGADALASEWKYVPVRRLALFIEVSLRRGTQWVIFERNDEALWSQIRRAAGAFLHDLFRRGAFQGRSPAEAYFVKCDADTTSQDDIDSGLVNVQVGFAPLRPAEFVVIRLSQRTGQAEP